MNPQIAAPEPQRVFEPFVDPDTAAEFLGGSRRWLLQMTRAGKILGHPLDPTSKKKDWRYKLRARPVHVPSVKLAPAAA